MDRGLRKRVHGKRFTIAFDEGGLRCTAKDRAAYVPYDFVVDATIANTYFGRTLLVLEISGEDKPLEIEVANGNPFDVLAAVVAAIARPHASSRWPALARNDEPIETWLARVRQLTAGEGVAGYRDRPIDVSSLATTLDDAGASAEERAAAAHALLEIGTDESLASVARTLVTRAVPPLVLVATRAGRAGDTLVDDELFADLRAWLALDDAAVAPSRPDEAQAARLAKILRDAQQEAADALEQAAREARGRKVHSLPADARSFDANRWIGRSWGL